VQFAVREFGNAGATATDKISAGFLLAGDSIASFVSGGVLGVAIAATVALGAAVVQAFSSVDDEAEKAREEFEALAKSAAEAQRSIAGLYLTENLKKQEARARGLEENLRAARKSLVKLTAEEAHHSKMLEEAQRKQTEGAGTWHEANLWAITKQREASLNARKELTAEGRKLVESLEVGLRSQVANIASASEISARKIEEDHLSAVSQTISKGRKLIEKAGQKPKADAKEKTTKKAKDNTAEIKAMEAEAAAALKRVADAEAHRRQVESEARAFDRNEKAEDRRLAREEHAEKLAAFQEEIKSRDQVAQRAAANEALFRQMHQKRVDDFKKAHEVEVMLLGVTTGALYDMAKAGEFSGAKLLATVLDAVGKEAMAKGTLHLLEGLATANPAKVTAGSGLIGLGLALGGASGAVDRSAGDQAAVASTTTTAAPADTRRSRAASSGSGGGDSGPVIIEFHGDVYDRRGVASVLSAGNRMSRHRRLAG